MDNKMKLEFYSRPENESFARSAVSAFIAYMDPTIEELTEIKTAVSEAVSNAVIHGYPGSREGMIRVECHSNEGRRVVIIVSDEGVGIENIEKAKEPLFTTGKSDERSGMGFTVMESFMDKVEIESERGKGTRVTMFKNLDLAYEL